MKSFLKKFIPESIRISIRRRLDLIILIREYFYDASRFSKWSSSLRDPNCKAQIAAHITMDYHRLEKGMALPEPRRGFGKDVVERLLTNIDRYHENYGADELCSIAVGVLAVYQDRQKMLDFHNEKLDASLDKIGFLNKNLHKNYGVKRVSNKDLFPFDTEDAERFIYSRQSVRNFTGELVSNEAIQRIVKLAQRAPSVCNRQCGRLYYTNDKKRISEVLKFQNGNSGFGHTLGGVFIVAADLSAFTSMGERNQSYVDGGIFAMQTLAAIHSQALGGCMLNWSMTSDRDKELRKEFGIPPEHIIITLIGFGHAVSDLEVAVSPRIDPSMVLIQL